MHAGACIRMTNAVTILRNSGSYGPSNADGSGARRICRACSPDLANVTKRESLGPLRHVIGLPALRRHRVWRRWMVAVPEMRALFHSYPGRLLHDMRRSAFRNLERDGVPRSAAMAMVGHRTEAIYRRYAIVDAGLLRDAAARIDRAAGTISGTIDQSASEPPASQSA